MLIICWENSLKNFRYADSFAVHFIDVGQGDCIFFQGPNGGTYLIKKTLINDNRSHIINQSSILFIPILFK